MNTLHALLAGAVLSCSCALAGQVTIHLSPSGSADGDGSAERPFASLQRARDEVRKAQAGGAEGVVVELVGGIYELSAPLKFTAEDSGSVACPIEYRAKAGEQARLVGGRVVRGFSPVSDAAILERLVPEARGKVFCADLRAQGIEDLQGISAAGWASSDPGLEVFFQDKPMTLSRYPNEGYMHITNVLEGDGIAKSGQIDAAEARFLCDDARPGRWAKEPEVWLHGFWVWDWADERWPLRSFDPQTQTVTMAEKPGRTMGVRKGQWFYAENVLAELDSPGEWYLDRESGRLYLWPPAPLSEGQVIVSTVRDMLKLDGVSHVTFRGLTIEDGRGTAVTISGGSQVRLVGCTIRNMGRWAVRVKGGTEHEVIGCDIYALGQGGVTLDAGDRQTLTRGNMVADNNHIHHIARWDPVYQPGIFLFGVGNSATHNLIDNVPHVAIGFSGNDQTIEYNEIHSAVFQSNDAGAIYTSPPDETWTMRGHRIRHNYLHNIHGFESRGCNGVYLDDLFSSADISGNIFYDVANAILIGGGRDNPIENNLFIKCGRAFSIDARGLGWCARIEPTLTEELKSFNYRQPPYSTRYPELRGILEDEPMAPKGNVVARNVCWQTPWGWTEPKAQPYVKFEDNLIDQDPLFAHEPPESFRLEKDSPAWQIGFKHLPLHKIGPYESPDRASWPVTSELRKDPPAPQAKPQPERVKTPQPSFDVPRATARITVDGVLNPEEWFGLDATKGIILQQGVFGNKCRFATKTWPAWDDEALYVAFDNAVDPEIEMSLGDTWGGNDAVELALSDPSKGDKPQILVLRGFACGKFVSSDEAGAPAELVTRAGEGVQYAARVIDAGRWVAEMRVPFAGLGINPNADVRYPANLSVRKMGDEAWVMWRGTADCTWAVKEAGFLRFVR